MVYIQGSGNCNFNYVTQLGQYYPRKRVTNSVYDPKQKKTIHTYVQDPHKLEEALYMLLTDITTPWEPPNVIKYGNRKLKHAHPGMYLFAQGSEDPERGPNARPYARIFANLIKANGLGKVHRIPATPNKLHSNKPGVLYVWRVNQEACIAWATAEIARRNEADKQAKELAKVK